MKYNNRAKAVLLLKDGTIFHGKSIGIEGVTFGEVAFNTGTTGYQEIFTDPSYFGQIMVTTNAHIGNYGINEKEVESDSGIGWAGHLGSSVAASAGSGCRRVFLWTDGHDRRVDGSGYWREVSRLLRSESWRSSVAHL
jgi:hypothetical protein